MNTIILDIIIAIVLVGAGAGVVYHHEHAEVVAAKAETAKATKALSDLVAQRAIDDATTASLAQKKAAIGRAGASAVASLQTAQGVHHDWASTPVPQEVQDALK